MANRTNLTTLRVISVFLVVLGAAATAAGGTIYVDADAGGANDGSSWTDAYRCLQNGLAAAWSGDEIRVAQGIYKPDEGVGITPGDREATFQLKNGVAIKGGYAGFGQPDPNERDIEAYETILSGDLNGNDVQVSDPCDLFNEPTRAENSYHVVTGSGTYKTAVLDGFIITGGYGNGNSSPDYYGGGMYNYDGSLRLMNCTFSGNLAYNGGGMYNDRGSPMLTDCTFSRNSARVGGGTSNNWSDPTLMNCTYSENSAIYDGGGMYNNWSNLTLTGCLFSGNSAYWGAGMYNDDASTVLTNCTFSGNSALVGGGMYNNWSDLMLTNCTFGGNSAEPWGGAGMVNYHSSPTLTNCTFIANSANALGGGMFNSFYSSPTLTNCMFSGNSARRGGGISNVLSSPMVANCIFSGNLAEHGGGLYNEGQCNPRLADCTFGGNSAPNGSALACDSYQQKYPSNLQLTNCILSDAGSEIWNNDQSTIRIRYSNIDGFWPGIGNINADPCFVDANNGDYHLLPDSPCIDAGDNTAVPADTADLDGDGDTTERIPFDLDGNPRFVDFPPPGGTGVADPPDYNDIVDMGAYEAVLLPMVEVPMKFTPQALNPGSKGNWVKAHFVLPEGFDVDDVDANTPAILQPGDVESEVPMNVFVNEANFVEVEAAFERGSFCEAGISDEAMEVRVVGSFTSGQYFYGTDTIKIINKTFEYLGVLASHWLEADCGAPDWCGGVDLDHSSAVDLVDFALFDGCCIEVIRR